MILEEPGEIVGEHPLHSPRRLASALRRRRRSSKSATKIERHIKNSLSQANVDASSGCEAVAQVLDGSERGLTRCRPTTAAALANIKRFDQLIAYLRDEMAWPIARVTTFDEMDDLFYDYTAGGTRHRPVRNSSQDSRVSSACGPSRHRQPWGIFFVKFEPKQASRHGIAPHPGAGSALKKRASANSSERTSVGGKEDLLFVSNYGEGDTAPNQLRTLLRRPTNGRDLPTLKVLGWDNRDTALHLDTVAKELTEHLAWPKNDE